MLIEFTVKICDQNGNYLRAVNAFACDLEMARCMVANTLGENEFIGGI